MAISHGNFMILQGGGPTGVINASLAGAVRAAREMLGSTCRIWGALQGIDGLMENRVIDLRERDAACLEEISRSPGAALGSSRRTVRENEIERLLEVCCERDIRYVISIGGNGTMRGSHALAEVVRREGIELVLAGIPKTIDNDLFGTDFCPGYPSCARFYAQSIIDLASDIRSLPTPVSVYEVMGRNAGWLAASTMLARNEPGDAPHHIYVPETPFSINRFLNDVQKVYDREGWVVMVVSEGLRDEKGEPIMQVRSNAEEDRYGTMPPGDVGSYLAQRVTADLGLRARSEKPGLLARTSWQNLSSIDFEAAEQVGRFAVMEALNGETDFMASISCKHSKSFELDYKRTPLNEVILEERILPVEYLTPSGNDVQETFREYIEPLVGEPLRRHRSWL